MADVFISYSRQDQPFAKRLHQALEVRGREDFLSLIPLVTLQKHKRQSRC